MKKIKTAFCSHRTDAKRRNITFNLTFEEWLAIWEQSGHLHERGTRKGQYCMARFGDVGSYAIDNVRIILHSENSSEMSQEYKKKPLLEETKRKISEAHKGMLHSEDAKIKMSLARRGKSLSESHKTAIAIGLKGKPKSQEHNAANSAAQKLSWARRKGLGDESWSI